MWKNVCTWIVGAGMQICSWWINLMNFIVFSTMKLVQCKMFTVEHSKLSLASSRTMKSSWTSCKVIVSASWWSWKSHLLRMRVGFIIGSKAKWLNLSSTSCPITPTRKHTSRSNSTKIHSTSIDLCQKYFIYFKMEGEGREKLAMHNQFLV